MTDAQNFTTVNSEASSSNSTVEVHPAPTATDKKRERFLMKYGEPAQKGAYRSMSEDEILSVFESHPYKPNTELGWTHFGCGTSDNLVGKLRKQVGAAPSPRAKNKKPETIKERYLSIRKQWEEMNALYAQSKEEYKKDLEKEQGKIATELKEIDD